ncbi:hypothetical protein [Streptomyces ossamyceticus]|uniref:hypothetical protein n=1 Tax=Streptomyces ossamyceticus TaxID=249581 RepID=UPI00341E4924
MKRDPLLWAALVAVLVVLASAEYRLAVACGFGQYVAAGVPAALDVYALAALRARRDVLAVVAVLIGVNAASHLVEVGLLPVDVPLVVAVSAVAPLVLWRVHSLGAGHVEAEAPAPEVTAPVTVERTDDDHPPAPAEAPKLVIPAVPPLASTPFQWSALPAPKVTAAVPAASPRQVVTAPVTLTPSDLRREARRLNREAVRSTKRPVTIKTLQDELGLSRREATELRREVVGAVQP